MEGPPNGFGMDSADKGTPLVASPRPNYGYSQAAFDDTASIYSQSSTSTSSSGEERTDSETNMREYCEIETIETESDEQ